MNDSPPLEQLAFELLVSIAISSAVALAFTVWVHPLAYVILGLVVALVLLGRRLAPRPSTSRWVPLAIVPIDAMLWPSAIVGDVLRARALAEAEQRDPHRKPKTASSEETAEDDGPGSHSDQDD